MTALARVETALAPLTAADVHRQVQLIQEVMRDVMREGEHYGKIPGCGDKPALLKAGAEKLGLTFKLIPTFKITKTELGNGHREYEIVCALSNRAGEIEGEGVGCCSTMEKKYRWRQDRTADEPTEVGVPKEYWDRRKAGAQPAELQAILVNAVGAEGKYGTKKIDEQWMIVRRGEQTEGRVENADIADTYNTVLKMAKKRAHVDAILTATAASDIFTQDIDEKLDDPDAPKVSKPAPQSAPDDDHHETYIPPDYQPKGNGAHKSLEACAKLMDEADSEAALKAAWDMTPANLRTKLASHKDKNKRRLSERPTRERLFDEIDAAAQERGVTAEALTVMQERCGITDPMDATGPQLEKLLAALREKETVGT